MAARNSKFIKYVNRMFEINPSILHMCACAKYAFKTGNQPKNRNNIKFLWNLFFINCSPVWREIRETVKN